MTQNYCILNSKHPCKLGQSENTSQKEVDIRKWFKLHQIVVSKIMEKNKDVERIYYYFDIGSGPGMCENIIRNGIMGSPIQFLKTINNDIGYKAFLFEKDIYCCRKLFNSVPFAFNIIHGNAEEMVPKIISTIPHSFRLGLVYMDYNGPPDIKLLKIISTNKKTRYMDILVNVPIGAYKRVLGYQNKYPNLKHKNKLLPLDDFLKVKKNVCYKGPKPGENRWTLFYLTNGPNIDWKKEGWKQYESEKN